MKKLKKEDAIVGKIEEAVQRYLTLANCVPENDTGTREPLSLTNLQNLKDFTIVAGRVYPQSRRGYIKTPVEMPDVVRMAFTIVDYLHNSEDMTIQFLLLEMFQRQPPLCDQEGVYQALRFLIQCDGKKTICTPNFFNNVREGIKNRLTAKDPGGRKKTAVFRIRRDREGMVEKKETARILTNRPAWSRRSYEQEKSQKLLEMIFDLMQPHFGTGKAMQESKEEEALNFIRRMETAHHNTV